MTRSPIRHGFAAPPRSTGRRGAPPAEHGVATTSDGVQIAFTRWRRASPHLVLIAPGFWRERLARENMYLATHFFRRGYDVAILDFRGHGESGGAYSFGLFEPLDLEAVVEALLESGGGERAFSIVGLSMGGSIAVDLLARRPELPCRALALISSPADFTAIRPRPWRSGASRQVSFKKALRPPRLAPRALFARREPAFRGIARVSIPKLIVTAEGDWLVDPAHGRALASAAAPPVEHVHFELPGSLHADALVRHVPLRVLRVLDRWFAANAPV